MSNLEPNASAASGRSVGELSGQVEQAAVQLVLGNLGSAEGQRLLKGIAETAASAGREDIERIVGDALRAVSETPEGGGADALISTCITQIQQILCAAEYGDGERSGAEDPASTPGSFPLGEDRELVGDFILESRDHLTQVELQMMTLEKNPEDAEAINTVFRAFHTIKGLAGFLDLLDIRETAHETETLLDLARSGKILITPTVVDVVLAASDFLKVSLLRLEQSIAGAEVAAAPEKQLLIE